MATRKSPARGTGRRPAKTTAAIDKPAAPAKKPLKLAAKPAEPEIKSTVIAMPTAEAAAKVVEAPDAKQPPKVKEPPKAEPPKVKEPKSEQPKIEEPPKVETVAAAPTAPDVDEEPVAAATPVAGAPAALSVVADEPDGDEPDDHEIEEADDVEHTPPPNRFAGAGMMPGFGAFPAFGAMDANPFVASGTALVEGAQALGGALLTFSRQTAERNMETAVAVLGAKSVEQALDLQQRHAMASIEDLMTESSRLAGMVIDVAGKATSPFTRS